MRMLHGRYGEPAADEARQVFAVRRMLELEMTRAFVREVTPAAMVVKLGAKGCCFIDGAVPAPEDFADPVQREGVARALQYMGLAPRTPITQIGIEWPDIQNDPGNFVGTFFGIIPGTLVFTSVGSGLGAVLDMTESAVKTRLHRARQALRGLLDPHFQS